MGSSSEDNDKPVSGTVITKEEENRMIAKRMSMVGSIFSRLSRFPIVNIWLRKKVETSRKVVQEETGLFDDLVAHGESFNRLDKIDELLREDNATYTANAIAAEQRLAEEERKAKARETDDRLFAKKKEYEEKELDLKHEYDLRILEAKYKTEVHPLEKAVEKLEKPAPEPSPKKKTTRGRSPKQKLREEVLKRYETEIARIEAMKKTAKVKATLTKAAEAEKEEELEKIEKLP